MFYLVRVPVIEDSVSEQKLEDFLLLLLKCYVYIPEYICIHIHIYRLLFGHGFSTGVPFHPAHRTIGAHSQSIF